MREFIDRNTPPGMNLHQEFLLFLLGNISAFLVSVVGFLKQYTAARERLFMYVNEQRVLIRGAEMVPFRALIDTYFLGFALVALLHLGFVFYHYAYFRQGSMSIYLVRRLPQKCEYRRLLSAVPSLAALATAIIAFATILLCYVIYLLATPAASLV